jgi:hypothetical protein
MLRVRTLSEVSGEWRALDGGALSVMWLRSLRPVPPE